MYLIAVPAPHPHRVGDQRSRCHRRGRAADGDKTDQHIERRSSRTTVNVRHTRSATLMLLHDAGHERSAFRLAGNYGRWHSSEVHYPSPAAPAAPQQHVVLRLAVSVDPEGQPARRRPPRRDEANSVVGRWGPVGSRRLPSGS